ncbi:MAG TPA: STAS domain-containing protein [Pseudonocardiaceae bacterium]|nr:STAS domain-containing protein [Pseudonocardiaceae bacterium]
MEQNSRKTIPTGLCDMHPSSHGRLNQHRSHPAGPVTPRAGQLIVLIWWDGVEFHVSCRGEIDMATTDQLYSAVINGVTDSDTRCIRIDLADVTFLSAAGLRSLVRIQAAAQEHGKALQLLRVPPLARRLLDIAGLDRLCRSE